MSTTHLLTKTLTDGRTLTITTDSLGNSCFVECKINGALVAKATIDRRDNPVAADRFAKLPTDIAAVIGGKIALKTADLAVVDAALAAMPKVNLNTPGVIAERAYWAERNAMTRRHAAGE